MPATLYVVATPIGNLEDITARALRVLREVSVIAAEDTRRTAHLLARYAISTPTTSLHEHNEHLKSAAIIERLKRGESVAVVSDAGTPTVSDPGGRLVRAAIDAGIRLEPIPGPSASLAALAVSGMPTERFVFMGFPPTRSKDRKTWLRDLGAAAATAIFFEAPHRIRRTLEDVHQAVGDKSVLVARELTKVHEELVRGPISQVITRLSEPRGEYTVVVDIGYITNTAEIPVPDPAGIATEFGVMTKNKAVTRRQAISALATKYGQSSREIYAAIEEAKSSGD
ncbi:MAG TPA: 16S rRNA (cytidine(1402)-2'-O)-methyltransferase [Vicinamibacterales bacterium]|jgi:16S rRNA (cytidine1402-2'-O)-methyltransferase|nr:16S rRNA (cytidine(1402)-2'-O)-methyltransferase [Vicinamibacterales bacterium]